MASLMSGSAYGGKFADELIETAARIVAPSKGILAADESTGTIGKRVSVRGYPHVNMLQCTFAEPATFPGSLLPFGHFARKFLAASNSFAMGLMTVACSCYFLNPTGFHDLC